MNAPSKPTKLDIEIQEARDELVQLRLNTCRYILASAPHKLMDDNRTLLIEQIAKLDDRAKIQLLEWIDEAERTGYMDTHDAVIGRLMVA